MEKFSFKRFIIAIMLGAVGVVSAIYAPTFLIVVAAGAACIGLSWGVNFLIISTAVAFAGTAAVNMESLYFAAVYAGSFLLSTVTLYACFKNKLSYRFTCFAMALIFAVVVFMLSSFSEVLAGNSPYAGFQRFFREMADYIRQVQPEQAAQLEQLAESISTTYYAGIAGIAQFFGFISVVICKRFCTLAKADVRPMAQLSRWQAPYSLRYGIPVIAVGCLILYLAGYKDIESIIYTAAGLFAPMFLVQGIAVITFLFSNGISASEAAILRAPSDTKRQSKAFYILPFTMALLFPMFVIIVGVFETYAMRRMKIERTLAILRQAFNEAAQNGSPVVTADLGDGRGRRVIAVRKRETEGAFFDGRDSGETPSPDPDKSDKKDETLDDDGNTVDAPGADKPDDGDGNDNDEQNRQ